MLRSILITRKIKVSNFICARFVFFYFRTFDNIMTTLFRDVVCEIKFCTTFNKFYLID